MRNLCIAAATTAILATLPAAVSAVPMTLDGLPMIKQWTDNEGIRDEMPGFIWGTADSDGVDTIGLYFEFQDGTTGGIVLSGVAPYWNTNTGPAFAGVTVESATGFFAAYAAAGVHFLYNTDVTTSYPEALPIAWVFNPATPFGSNVEPDYNDTASGSELRISGTGWGYVNVATYGGDGVPPQVPLPASGLLLFGALTAVAVSRRKARS